MSELRRNMMAASRSGGDNGLFAYWDSADAPVNNTNWVDKISGLKLKLSRADIYSDGIYKIPFNNRIIMSDDISGYLDNELMVEIGFDMWVNSSYYKALDFGALGQCKWNYGFMLAQYSDGNVFLNAKNASNATQAVTQGIGASYSTSTWFYNNVAIGGIRLRNGYQQVWAKINNSTETYTGNLQAYKLTPVPVNGAQNINNYGYFSVGAQGSAININEQMVVHYIKLYNTSL